MQLIERLPGLGNELSKKTIKEQISDKLAYMICSGLLQIGDELPSERELASMLDVSRVTVRGAITTLAARGMIEVSQGSRTRVIRNEGYALHDAVSSLRGLKDFKIDSVYEARKVVETSVVQDAARRISDKELKRMDSLLAQQADMFDDPVRFQISDREFHSVMYGASSNPLLITFVEDLYAYALDFRRTAMKKRGAVKRSYEDHMAIMDALKRHDPEAAGRAVSAHLDQVYKTTLTAMKKSEGR
jgi:DNA-binding FadR family transcriptional regulator